MTKRSHHMLFSATRWRLILLNATVLCAVLLAITGFLFLVEVVATDAEMTKLLTQTVQQEQGEDLVQIVRSHQPITDPPRPFSPAPLQVFFFLVDLQGRVHEGAAYRLPGLPDHKALQNVLAAGTSDRRDITVHGFHLRLLTVVIRDKAGTPVGAIQAYVSLQGRDAELQRMLLVLLVGSALGVGLSALAARFLATRALIPIWQAFEQQEQFVADASHELRAPLTLLRADVEILQRALGLHPLSRAAPKGSQGTEDSHTYLQLSRDDGEIIDEIAAEIGHMDTLITDLLTLAKYDADVYSPPREIVNLSPLLSSVAERMKPQIAQSHLTFHLLLPDDQNTLMVAADPAGLRRLFVILLNNAITYTPAGGHIWFQARAISGKQVEVTVCDTGNGIAAADLPHLFARFYRADKARTRHSEVPEEHASSGTGLGLAIAQSIVQNHEGTITASSPGEGQGSTFTVILKKTS